MVRVLLGVLWALAGVLCGLGAICFFDAFAKDANDTGSLEMATGAAAIAGETVQQADGQICAAAIT